MMLKFLLGGAALAAMVPAFAQTPAPPPAPVTPYVAPVPPAPPAPPMVARVKTRNEMVAMVREHFARLDTNQDGFLTQAEADAGHAGMKERWQSQGIGHAMNVKRGDPAAAFDRLDTNKDGAISRDEFALGREKRVERRIVMRDRTPEAPGGARQQREMRMHRMGGMIGGRMFAMADANKDNRVSLQEATDAAVRHFDAADANRDGQVTRDERRVIRRQMRAQPRSSPAG